MHYGQIAFVLAHYILLATFAITSGPCSCKMLTPDIAPSPPHQTKHNLSVHCINPTTCIVRSEPLVTAVPLVWDGTRELALYIPPGSTPKTNPFLTAVRGTLRSVARSLRRLSDSAAGLLRERYVQTLPAVETAWTLLGAIDMSFWTAKQYMTTWFRRSEA